jgi:hypothetical protein
MLRARRYDAFQPSTPEPNTAALEAMLADYERMIALKDAIIDANDKEIGHLHQTIMQLDEELARLRQIAAALHQREPQPQPPSVPWPQPQPTVEPYRATRPPRSKEPWWNNPTISFHHRAGRGVKRVPSPDRRSGAHIWREPVVLYRSNVGSTY